MAPVQQRCDEHTGWDIGGSGVTCRYLCTKLLDYTSLRAELEASDNPVAAVTLAHLDALATHRSPKDRARRKLAMAKLLFSRGWESDRVWELFDIIDWLMSLPEPEQIEFEEALDEVKEEPVEMHLNRWAREGLRRGFDQGRVEGLSEMAHRVLLDALSARLGSVPAAIEAKVLAADPEWCRAAVPRVYRGEPLPELGL